jgi:hypothetical protein
MMGETAWGKRRAGGDAPNWQFWTCGDAVLEEERIRKKGMFQTIKLFSVFACETTDTKNLKFKIAMLKQNQEICSHILNYWSRRERVIILFTEGSTFLTHTSCWCEGFCQ